MSIQVRKERSNKQTKFTVLGSGQILIISANSKLSTGKEGIESKTSKYSSRDYTPLTLFINVLKGTSGKMIQCLLLPGCFLGMLPSINKKDRVAEQPNALLPESSSHTLPAISIFLRMFLALQPHTSPVKIFRPWMQELTHLLTQLSSPLPWQLELLAKTLETDFWPNCDLF